MIRQPKKRWKAKKWILCICAAFVLFLFRKSLIIGIVKVALTLSFSGKTSSFTYEKIQWENAIIRIDDISYANQDAAVLIDQVNIALSGTLFSWQVHCKVFHPQITVKPGGSSPNAAPLHFLLAPQYASAKIFWELHDGILQLDENPPLYFSFLPDPIVHRKGKVALSYEPQSEVSPLFTAVIEEKEEIFEIEFSLVEEDCSRLLPIAMALLPELPKAWEKTQGKVDASGRLRVDRDGSLTDLSCRWQIDQLALASASSGIELSAEHLSGGMESDVLLPLDQLWLKGKGSMLFQGVECSISSLTPYRFKVDNGEIVLEPDREPYFALQGMCEYKERHFPFNFSASGELHSDAAFFLKFQGECGINGMQLDGSVCHFDEGKYAVQLHFENFLFEHLEFFTAHLPLDWRKEKWLDGACAGTTTLIWENGTLQADMELISGSEKILAGALFDGPSPWKLKEGWFETEKITQRIYGPLLKLLSIDIPFTGDVQLKGNFDPAYCVLSLQGSDCVFHHDQGDLLIPSFGETGIELIYSVKEKKLKGEISLQDAKWSSRDPLYHIESLNATAYLDGKILNISSFSGICQEHAFQGKLSALRFDPASNRLEWEKAEAQVSLRDGNTLHVDLLQCTLDAAKEELSAHFCLCLERNQKHVLELSGAAERGQAGNWDIAFDRQRTRFLDTLLHISGCHISPEHRIALQMQPVLSCEELLQNITWLSDAGLVSFPVEKIRDLSCRGMLQLTLSTSDVSGPLYFKVESKDLSMQGKKLAPFVLEGNKNGQHFELKECRGEGFVFKACGDVKEGRVKLIDLEGQFRGTACKASGDLDLSTYAFNISLDSLKGNTSPFIPVDQFDGTFSAHGTLKGVLSTPFSLEADAVCTLDIAKPLPITVWNVKPLKISYAQESGLRIQELGAYLKSKKEGIVFGLISLGQCSVPSTWDALQEGSCQFSMNPLILKECANANLLPSFFKEASFPDKIEGTAEFQKGSEGWMCRAALKDGTFRLAENTSLALQKIALQCQRGVFTVQGKTNIGQQSLWGALSIALTKNPQAILRITDDPKQDGIRMHFKCKEDQLLWEKIQGTCLGVQCALTKSDAKKPGAASVLSGRIAIDASQLSSFFSPALQEKWAQFKLGKGYSWQGDLILYPDAKRRFQMTGEIIGDEWELLGYCFKKLRASMDAHPHYILLSNVLLEDEAGTISIKKMEVEKKEHWELSIPLISIREWHPSSMRKIDALPSALKPFLIRNFTLSGIHVDLEKAGSLEGHGKLTFTNYSKKEATLLDTPIEMIKNFGLDPGILTPTQGEIDLDLKGDKMYLVGLRDAFSEAKRSEFYLAPNRELSYIDLDGKMHIDLKMRQDVTLKITEPFILTIRGTLENPRYGLNLLP